MWCLWFCGFSYVILFCGNGVAYAACISCGFALRVVVLGLVVVLLCLRVLRGVVDCGVDAADSLQVFFLVFSLAGFMVVVVCLVWLQVCGSAIAGFV